MCTVLLPPGDNPIAVNKYIISYIYRLVIGAFIFLVMSTKELLGFINLSFCQELTTEFP